MSDPHDTIRAVEHELVSLRQWRDSHPSPTDFGTFAQQTAKAEEILEYGTLLYPKFLKVDGVVVLESHYEPNNWAKWRQRLAPVEAAAMVNHTHVTDLLHWDYKRAEQLEDAVGQVLAFFWKMAVDRQFPGNDVVVEYDGDVIQLYQRGLETGSTNDL